MIVSIGYFASALLALSLIVTNALKFRWLNTFGCITFIVYGVFINAFPVIVANTILLCINIFQLIKLYTIKETFEMVAVKDNDELVEKFLSFYKKDIKYFFPQFNYAQTGQKRIGFVVLRDLSIANIFIARLKDDGNAIVEINYTVPNYRDYKVGRFIFEKENDYLLQKGIKQLVYEQVTNTNHEHFIKKMGFAKQLFDGRECYMKLI
jgi:hypothetical protein